MTDETDNTEQAPLDFFGESLVVAPRETHSALEAAAQALAEGRVWSLGERTHYGQCARFEIVSATDGRFLARLSGAETWQPRLVVAREEAALDDDLEEATDYVTLNVQYHVRRDGGVDASGVHFRGDDPQQLSNREVAFQTTKDVMDGPLLGENSHWRARAFETFAAGVLDGTSRKIPIHWSPAQGPPDAQCWDAAVIPDFELTTVLPQATACFGMGWEAV